MESTKPSYGSMELYNVWAVDREGEAQRFKAFHKMDNRKLLWHGTNGKIKNKMHRVCDTAGQNQISLYVHAFCVVGASCSRFRLVHFATNSVLVVIPPVSVIYFSSVFRVPATLLIITSLSKQTALRKLLISPFVLVVVVVVVLIFTSVCSPCFILVHVVCLLSNLNEKSGRRRRNRQERPSDHAPQRRPRGEGYLPRLRERQEVREGRGAFVVFFIYLLFPQFLFFYSRSSVLCLGFVSYWSNDYDFADNIMSRLLLSSC